MSKKNLLQQGALRGISMFCNSVANSVKKSIQKTDDNDEGGGGGKAFSLSPGKHTIQLQVMVGVDGAVTMGNPELTPQDDAAEATVLPHPQRTLFRRP